ncbi:protein of unknown function [Rhodovastum atsumiense]|nr:protein of unknown function [Rhodovastum atsumiense]
MPFRVMELLQLCDAAKRSTP